MALFAINNYLYSKLIREYFHPSGTQNWDKPFGIKGYKMVLDVLRFEFGGGGGYLIVLLTYCYLITLN